MFTTSDKHCVLLGKTVDPHNTKDWQLFLSLHLNYMKVQPPLAKTKQTVYIHVPKGLRK